MRAKKNTKISYPSSEKIYVPGTINKVEVGMRLITLSDSHITNEKGETEVKRNSPVVLYDTSGPYSDPRISLQDFNGIPRIREELYKRRKDITRFARKSEPAEPDASAMPRIFYYKAKEGKVITQLYYAKKRIITPEMEYVAIRENQQVETLGLKSYITPDFVRKEVAAGRAVIPANINHPEMEPMIIGKKFRVKVNSNLRNPLPSEGWQNTLEQMVLNCKWGNDTLISLPQNNLTDGKTNEWLLRNCPVPVGTVPLYEALMRVDNQPEKLDWTVFREVLIEQAEQGIDFFIIHAALLRSYIDMTLPRLTGIVSKAGSILAQWMKVNNKENFLYTHFHEICEILCRYDVTLVLGDGLYPGSVYDANDMAHLAELHTKGQLTRIAWEHFVQVMIEGSGALPMNKIPANVKEQQYACQHAPYFTCGPLTTDIGEGYAHITSAIGAAQMAWQGAALIGGITPDESLCAPDKEDYRNAILTFKLAAHAADLAKGHPGAQTRDNALRKAGIENRREDQISLSLDPERVIQSLKRNAKKRS